MQSLTMFLSLLGAFLGMTSFYLTQLRPAKITVVIDKRIRAGYATNGPGFGFYVPITFVNSSSHTGVVNRVCLLLQHLHPEGPIYCIDFSRFSELNDKEGRLFDVALPHPFAVPGHSSVSKLIRFMWWNSSKPPMVIESSEYQFTICIWTTSQKRPSNRSRHLFAVTKEQINQLTADWGSSIEIVLDGDQLGNSIVEPKDLVGRFGVQSWTSS